MRWRTLGDRLTWRLCWKLVKELEVCERWKTFPFSVILTWKQASKPYHIWSTSTIAWQYAMSVLWNGLRASKITFYWGRVNINVDWSLPKWVGSDLQLCQVSNPTRTFHLKTLLNLVLIIDLLHTNYCCTISVFGRFL